MLPREALEAALPLTEQLDARGVFLRPVQGTPLAALVAATRADEKFNVALDGGGYYPDLANIEFAANAQPSDGTLNAHDCAMDSVVAVAIQTVQRSMYVAKSVVAPAVQELVENVKLGLTLANPSQLLGLEVKVVELPELLCSPAFEGALRKYQSTPLDDPRMIANMPTLTPAEIADLMLAGGAGVNSEIQAFIAAKGDKWLCALWAEAFQTAPVSGRAIAPSFQELIAGDEGLDNAIGIFLLARRLISAAPAGVEMSARALEQVMAEYRNQAAARLCRAMDAEAQVRKGGQLVRKQAGRTVWVNGSVYRTWLKEGGGNEQLFGNLLSTHPVYLAKDFKAKGAGLKAAWDRHAALTNTVEQGRRVMRTKELLAQCFEQQVNAVAEGDASLSGSRAEVIKLFNDQLDAVREDDLDDIYNTALRLVCRSRFVKTDAERILSSVERVKRDNPEIDIREAAAIAMVQYVAWWVSTQFKPEIL